MVKKKGVITITEIGVNFSGHNEGSGSPMTKNKEVTEQVNSLIKQHKDKYKLEVIDNRDFYEEEFEIEDEPLPRSKFYGLNTNEEEIKAEEEKAEKEFEEALNNISKNSSSVIEEIYYEAKHKAKMVALGHRKGLIIVGGAGLGKSHNIMKAFEEVGQKFVYMSGHITNLALYEFLYNHRQKHIIFDDVNILDNEINLNMLKSALNDKLPFVSYNTSSSKLKVPKTFKFEGSITILLNKKPKNDESLRAVESRILNIEMKLDYRQKLKVMKEISFLDYKTTKQKERDEIFSWIKKNTNEATINFNLRDLFKLFDFYIYNKEIWKTLAKNTFPKSYELDLIIQGLNYKEWGEQTGKSMKSYYRCKKKLK